jgi:hypothetical protein
VPNNVIALDPDGGSGEESIQAVFASSTNMSPLIFGEHCFLLDLYASTLLQVSNIHKNN